MPHLRWSRRHSGAFWGVQGVYKHVRGDEVFPARAWLRERGVPIHFEGRRRAGYQIAIE